MAAKKSVIMLTTPDAKARAWGVPIGQFFAWTPAIPRGWDPNDPSVIAGPCTILTHVPTGYTVSREPRTLAAAKAITARFEALPINWNNSDPKFIVNMEDADLRRRCVEISKWDGREEKKAAKPVNPMLARILASPEWGGSTVEIREEQCAEQFGHCPDDLEHEECEKAHVIVWGAPDGRNKLRPSQRRHVRTIKMHVITHPSGAVARVPLLEAEREEVTP